MFRTDKCMFLMVLVLLACSATAWTQAVPSSISYQGKLTSAAGTPVADGNHGLVLKLYTAETGGTAVWSSPSTPVTTRNGVFSTAFAPPAGVFDNGSLWIETVVGGAALAPRAMLRSVPFSIRASTADTAKSVPDGSITAAKLAADVVFTRAPYVLGVKSGLDSQYSVRILIDGQLDEVPVTLAEPYKEWIVPPSGPGAIPQEKRSPLVLRRRVTSNNTWRQWGLAGSPNHSVTIKLMNGIEDAVSWTFSSGQVLTCRFRLADDGLPVEEIAIKFPTRPQRATYGSGRGTTLGAGTQVGLTSGQPDGSVYGLAASGANYSDISIAGDLLYGWGEEGHRVCEPLVVRQHPLARNSIYDWYRQTIVEHQTVFRDASIILKNPGETTKTLVILDEAGPNGTYTLKLADDGLPIEEFGLAAYQITMP